MRTDINDGTRKTLVVHRRHRDQHLPVKITATGVEAFSFALREVFMAKGYPIDLPLQTKLAAESSIVTVIFNTIIVAATCPEHGQSPLTMNSVARHAITN